MKPSYKTVKTKQNHNQHYVTVRSHKKLFSSITFILISIYKAPWLSPPKMKHVAYVENTLCKKAFDCLPNIKTFTWAGAVSQ